MQREATGGSSSSANGSSPGPSNQSAASSSNSGQSQQPNFLIGCDSDAIKFVVTQNEQMGSNSGEYILPKVNTMSSFNDALIDDSGVHITETFSSVSISSRSSYCADPDQDLDFAETLTSASSYTKVGKVIPVTIQRSDSAKSEEGPLESFFRKISKLKGSNEDKAMHRCSSTSQLQAVSSPGMDRKSAPSLIPPNARSKAVSASTSPSHRAAAASGSPISTQALILHQRPGNLPQKDPKEEQLHQEEYRRLLEDMRKKDCEKQRVMRKHRETRWKHEQDVSTMQYLWNKEVIPNWSSHSRESSKVRDLWWYGIPPSVRTKVWPLAVGNDLNITSDLFDLYVDRSADLIKALNLGRREVNGEMKCTENTVELIRLDVSRTFINLTMFQKGGPYHESLQQLLALFVCYRPDIGYVQGMNIIAAILLLYLEVKDAFIAFANLINRPLLISFFRMDECKMSAFYHMFNLQFSAHLPNLFAHFQQLQLTPDIYLLDWILSLYSKALPLDISCRIIDLYLRDGDSFVFRAALGILKLFESHLLQLDFVPVAQFLINLPPEKTDPDKLFSAISSISLSRRKYDKLCEKYLNTNS